jgi:histidinol-phosphatase (PHP family)
MCERGIPVVIGADAHVPLRVGDGYAEALQRLRTVGYHEVSYFIDRQRQTVPIDAALESISDIKLPA